jgi:hypothetical protein
VYCVHFFHSQCRRSLTRRFGSKRHGGCRRLAKAANFSVIASELLVVSLKFVKAKDAKMWRFIPAHYYGGRASELVVLGKSDADLLWGVMLAELVVEIWASSSRLRSWSWCCSWSRGWSCSSWSSVLDLGNIFYKVVLVLLPRYWFQRLNWELQFRSINVFPPLSRECVD